MFFLVLRNSSNKRRIGGAALIRGRRLLTFLSQMRRLFEGGPYSSKYGISDLVGLINLQVGLFAKFGLWSFRDMNASLLAVMSTLSSMPSFAAMFLFSVWMARVVVYSAFLNDLVIW